METRSSPGITTTNLTLATYLSCLDEECEMTRTDQTTYNGDPIGAWVFGESVQALIDEFNAGDALVEPNSFHRNIGPTRRAMERFLGQ